MAILVRFPPGTNNDPSTQVGSAQSAAGSFRVISSMPRTYKIGDEAVLLRF